MRSFFRFAIDNNVARQNPAKGATDLKVVQDEQWIPTEEEFGRFVQAAGETPCGFALVPWLWFRAYTGTRPTESVFVEWDHTNSERDQISIRPKEGHELKNAKFRVVEIHMNLKPILLAWREEWQARHARWLRRERAETARDQQFSEAAEVVETPTDRIGRGLALRRSCAGVYRQVYRSR